MIDIINFKISKSKMQKAIAVSSLLGLISGQQILNLEQPKVIEVSDEAGVWTQKVGAN